MRAKDVVGRRGEQIAADHLTSTGHVLLDRNWRCKDGELDIVCRDGGTLVFVEVKTRTSTAYGDPAEAISVVKAARIRRLAIRWLDEHRSLPAPHRRELRFDVVSVLAGVAGTPTVRHLRAAF